MALKKMYGGIDPGKTGAVAFLYENEIKVFDFEDYAGLLELKKLGLDPLGEYDVFIVIEKVHSMPKQGVVSTFNFGANYGQWLGRLESLNIPYDLVTPAKWQKEIFGAGAKTGDRKQMSLEKARRLFPTMADYLARKKDHNRADALLIAEYCRRTQSGYDGMKV